MHTFEKSGLGIAPFKYVNCIDAGKVAGSCDYCSTGIRYAFIIQDVNGKEFKVGSDCVGKTNDSGLKRTVNRVVYRRRKEAKRAKQQAEWDAKTDAIREAFQKAQPEVFAFLQGEQKGSFMQDMAASVKKWGALTEGQLNAVKKTMGKKEEILTEVPEGRLVVSGKVVSTKAVENQYGCTIKGLVVCETPEGVFKVWGTMPQALLNAAYELGLEETPEGEDNPCGMESLKGRQVEFTATIARSDDDSSFGFFKRPSKASIKS